MTVSELILGDQDKITDVELRRVDVGLLVVLFDSFVATPRSHFIYITVNLVDGNFKNISLGNILSLDELQRASLR